ncbi:MAG: DNA gyrase inhibitor YacG [Thermoguttaceae bacterium]
MRCSICKKNFSEEDPGVVMPFCSQRCQQIDAKRWFCEEYGLPVYDLDKIERVNAEEFHPITDDEHPERS